LTIKNADTLTINVGLLGLMLKSVAKKMIRNAGATPMPHLPVPFPTPSAGMTKSPISPVPPTKLTASKVFSHKWLHASSDKTAGKDDLLYRCTFLNLDTFCRLVFDPVKLRNQTLSSLKFDHKIQIK
jgi:hypothetical protein